MPENRDETLRQIERTQQSLRESIESAKELAVRSERLIARHRQELASGGTASD